MMIITGGKEVKERVRRFRHGMRTLRQRIEIRFNTCLDRFLPPIQQRTSCYVMIVGFVFLCGGILLGHVATEIMILHEQRKAIQIWVDDRA